MHLLTVLEADSRWQVGLVRIITESMHKCSLTDIRVADKHQLDDVIILLVHFDYSNEIRFPCPYPTCWLSSSTAISCRGMASHLPSPSAPLIKTKCVSTPSRFDCLRTPESECRFRFAVQNYEPNCQPSRCL